jgi:phosphate transport system substrate-binding protein
MDEMKPSDRMAFPKMLIVLFVLSTGFWAGCQKPKGGLTVAGSTSVQPFAEMLAEEYMAHHRESKVFIQGGGSSAGIEAVRTGAADIGMSSRRLMAREKELIAAPIAYDAIAVIVNPQNPLNDLSVEQIRGIFAGKLTNWKGVGGRDHSLTMVTREEGSGTREAFQKMVMGKHEISLGGLVQDSNGAIRQVVSDDPNAIGYISLGLVDKSVKALKINGIQPNLENIMESRYKIIRPFLFVFRSPPEGLARDFLDFILSAEGQKLLKQEGLISPDDVPSQPGTMRQGKQNV